VSGWVGTGVLLGAGVAAHESLQVAGQKYLTGRRVSSSTREHRKALLATPAHSQVYSSLSRYLKLASSIQALGAELRLGTALGLSDGEALGTPLGVSDGETLGISDGEALGAPLGVSDGDVLGAPLGVSDGDVLGAPLGVSDGDVLGATLGTSEGELDGRLLGTVLGPELVLGALLELGF